MVEQVKSFMEADWKKLARDFSDFNEPKQAVLRKVMAKCSADTEFPMESKPYDTEHDNFKYFALCLRNNVSINPALNGSKGVKTSVLGWTY